MTRESELTQKRKDLKRQLAEGEYKTLIDIIFEGTSRLIQNLTRNPKPISLWYSAGIIALLSLLISLITSILLGEFYPARRGWIPGDLWIAALIALTLIAFKVGIHIFSSTLQENILDALESEKYLDNLQYWLTVTSKNVKAPLFIGLVMALFSGFYLPFTLASTQGGFPGFGPIILNAIWVFLNSVGSYYFLLGIVLIVRLSGYPLKVYRADPSNSKLINNLSGTLNNIMLIAAVYAAIWTLGLAFVFQALNERMTFLVALAWGAITVIFVGNQYVLARIIVRAKWRTLSNIQAKIEELQEQEAIPTKDILEHINALMDYHDRIRATRNSALDFRAGLNFLNSLLLPLFAFILGNLDSILARFNW